MNLIIPFIFRLLCIKISSDFISYIFRGLHRTGHVRVRVISTPFGLSDATGGHVATRRRFFHLLLYPYVSYSCAKPYKEQVVYKKIKNGCTVNFRNISESAGEKGCSR